MSGNCIKIHTSAVRQAAADILRGNKEQLARLTQIKKTIDQVAGSWNSPAASQLTQASAKIKKDIQLAEAQMNRHADFLNDVAQAYLEADEKITASARSFAE